MPDPMEQLRSSLQAAPVIWKGDYPYFIHPVTDGVPRMDPKVLSAITQLVADRVDWSGVDILLGIEAMGLPLTAPLSMATGIPLVVARKRAYGLDGEVEIDQSTGYSKGAMYLNDLNQGERVAIVDDVLSTGGTLEAVIEGVRAVTHIAPADPDGTIIGSPVVDDGVILYDYTALGLCGGVTNAPLTTTTEVYPDSPKATDELCNMGQVAAITSALDFLLASLK